MHKSYLACSFTIMLNLHVLVVEPVCMTVEKSQFWGDFCIPLLAIPFLCFPGPVEQSQIREVSFSGLHYLKAIVVLFNNYLNWQRDLEW